MERQIAMGAKSETFAQHHNDICYTEDFVEQGCEVGDIRTASQRYLLYRRLRRARGEVGDIRTASQRYLLYRRLRRARVKVREKVTVEKKSQAVY